MERKLSQIISPWRRRSITVYMKSLLFLTKFAGPRARIHWVGRYDRPRRPQRVLFALVFLGSLLAFGSRQYMFWSTLWGGALAIFLNLHMIYRLIPRKRAHYVK